MTAEAQARDPHSDIHSEGCSAWGSTPDEVPIRWSKVRGLAWLEFAKPDLVRAEAFARAFGFETACRTTDTLYLRADAGSPCVVIRKGRRTRFLDLHSRLPTAPMCQVANSMGVRATPIGEPPGGVGVSVLDPSGMPLRVVADVDQLPAIGAPAEPVFNFGSNRPRTNTPVRPPRTPARSRGSATSY